METCVPFPFLPDRLIRDEDRILLRWDVHSASQTKITTRRQW